MVSMVKVEDYVKAKTQFQSKINQTCSFCFKVFGKVSKRILHETTQHGGQGRDFVCNDCETKFTNKNALVYHWMKNHGGGAVPKIICEVCKESFTSKVSLKEHREANHKDSTVLSCENFHIEIKFVEAHEVASPEGQSEFKLSSEF